MKWLKRLGWGLAGIAAALLVAIFVTARPGDPNLWPPAFGGAISIHVVNHGYHAGLVVPRAQLAEAANREGLGALIAIGQRFGTYPWLEIGWGDEGFYRSVPDISSLTVASALRALFLPGNTSVLHVVGVEESPRSMFPRADMVQIELGDPGFQRMLKKIDATFARTAGAQAEDAGPGLYGPSRFYRAVGAFHIFNVCNHWVADVLDAAGVPTAPVLAALPAGLLLDLKWRAGVTR